MSAMELAAQMQDFLFKMGSIDAKIVEGADIALNYGLSSKASAALNCADRSLSDLFESNAKFEELALGNNNCFAVPYGQHLVLIFDTEEENERLQVGPGSIESIKGQESQVGAMESV